MARRPNSSRQTEAVLAALLDSAQPGSGEWRHGYDLSRVTGLKSGTLYPILMRLEQQGLLEAVWEDEPAPGRPRRHLYRLTGTGVEQAKAIVRASGNQATAAIALPAEGGGP